eukprot:6260322-Heterocapsa_arctica.AAC.1
MGRHHLVGWIELVHACDDLLFVLQVEVAEDDVEVLVDGERVARVGEELPSIPGTIVRWIDDDVSSDELVRVLARERLVH